MKRKAREDLCFGVFVLICVATFVLCAVVTASEYDYPSDTLNGDVNMDGRICMDDSMQIVYHLWRDGRDLPCRSRCGPQRGNRYRRRTWWTSPHFLWRPNPRLSDNLPV